MVVAVATKNKGQGITTVSATAVMVTVVLGKIWQVTTTVFATALVLKTHLVIYRWIHMNVSFPMALELPQLEFPNSF